MLLLIGCVSPSKAFYKKRHPKENTRSLNEKRGLMLLENSQIGRNKYMVSKSYSKKLKKSHKKLH